MEDKTIISFANVSANYDSKHDVLNDISFNISSGSFYFLTGTSGAGNNFAASYLSVAQAGIWNN